MLLNILSRHLHRQPLEQPKHDNCHLDLDEGQDGSIHLAVMTSGGDAQGMNACIRAVVRRAIVCRASVFAILEGYLGLVTGQGHIISLGWNDVSGLLSKGGTIIGTSRCPAFHTIEGRRAAVCNLVTRGIDRLVVIGGDGSLTGADCLAREWSDHLLVLKSQNLITEVQYQRHNQLRVVGLVGSIDNDFCGTDQTIGSDSALNRIVSACDCIMTTASSHQRTFIIEVMGRHCGFLALQSALAVGADYVFLPEAPALDSPWTDKLCRAVERGRSLGRRHTIVILAEGATDGLGSPITADDIKRELETKLALDTRVTILGHVQRGGAPSASDRIIATRLGAAAADAVLEMNSNESSFNNSDVSLIDTEKGVLQTRTQSSNVIAIVLGIRGDQIIQLPLMESVQKTQCVVKALNTGDYALARQLRGSQFGQDWTIFKDLARTSLKVINTLANAPAIAIMHVGQPAPAMNSATRALTRLALSQGYLVYGIFEGCRGLAEGRLDPLSWIDVDGWSNVGGVMLGTNKESLCFQLESCACNLQKYRIQALFIIGGWNACIVLDEISKLAKGIIPTDRSPSSNNMTSVHSREYGLEDAEKVLPPTFLQDSKADPDSGSSLDFRSIFSIPVMVLPATICNNCPNTLISLGADTALNSIVSASDCLKQSAISSRSRVFIMEVNGGQCGYLATTASIACGAHCTYTAEQGITLQQLSHDLEILIERFSQNKTMALIINSDRSNSTYTTHMIEQIFNEESRQLFETRTLFLGHVQQGNRPSPIDRILGSQLAYKACQLLQDYMDNKERSTSTPPFHGLVGKSKQGDLEFIPVEILMQNMDETHHRPHDQPWYSVLYDVIGSLKIGQNKLTKPEPNSRAYLQKLLRGNSIRQFSLALLSTRNK